MHVAGPPIDRGGPSRRRALDDASAISFCAHTAWQSKKLRHLAGVVGQQTRHVRPAVRRTEQVYHCSAPRCAKHRGRSCIQAEDVETLTR
eukprot:14175893-Alexandrium_andersonii.AAC.1